MCKGSSTRAHTFRVKILEPFKFCRDVICGRVLNSVTALCDKIPQMPVFNHFQSPGNKLKVITDNKRLD